MAIALQGVTNLFQNGGKKVRFTTRLDQRIYCRRSMAFTWFIGTPHAKMFFWLQHLVIENEGNWWRRYGRGRVKGLSVEVRQMLIQSVEF